MPGIEPHGILVDLRSLDEVFVIDDDMGMDMDMDSTLETTFMVIHRQDWSQQDTFKQKA